MERARAAHSYILGANDQEAVFKLIKDAHVEQDRAHALFQELFMAVKADSVCQLCEMYKSTLQ